MSDPLDYLMDIIIAIITYRIYDTRQLDDNITWKDEIKKGIKAYGEQCASDAYTKASWCSGCKHDYEAEDNEEGDPR